MSNYVSPYGFGPVADAVIDCVGDRHDMDMAAAFDRLPADKRQEIEWRADEWWQSEMGPAVDRMEALLSEYIDLEET